MAMATLPDSKVDWAGYIDDYDRIRDRIAEVYPTIYADFGARIANPRGFHLDIPPRRRVWPTPNGKANFLLLPGLAATAPVGDPTMLRLATVRPHDHFNTPIHTYKARSRGVKDNRMVLFVIAEERPARDPEA